LHASAHHSALDLRACNQWRRLTEARHQQIRRKLEQVAQWRLSLLLSGADERMAKVRQLARRMLKKLEYMVFTAWREWYVPARGRPKRLRRRCRCCCCCSAALLLLLLPLLSLSLLPLLSLSLLPLLSLSLLPLLSLALCPLRAHHGAHPP